MSEALLQQIRDLIQEDINARGLRTDPALNLINACPNDFESACRSIAETTRPKIAIVTGFYIPDAGPPAAETDGPLGALFLARAFAPLGISVLIAAESYCMPALRAGLEKCGLQNQVKLHELETRVVDFGQYVQSFFPASGEPPFTHLIALERPGPAHTLESVQAQIGLDQSLMDVYLEFMRAMPPIHYNHHLTMRGVRITEYMSPAHIMFEIANSGQLPITTIGIGDGGNEIGMGKIPWSIIHRNIPGGGAIACRVPTHHLIVAGISNWGAYGLAAGVRLLQGQRDNADLFTVPFEAQLLRHMVEHGPLVDGITGKQQTTVDGQAFDKYGRVLLRLSELLNQ